MLLNPKHPQRGTAIIMVMLIVAIVVVATTSMLLRVQNGVQNTRLLLNGEAGYLYAEGAESWAIGKLADLHGPLLNPLEFPALSIPKGTIRATLEDAQHKINVNLAIGEDVFELFSALAAAQLNTPPESRAAWVNQLVDFIASRPPGQLTSLTELRQFSPLSLAQYNNLTPAITSLPGQTPVNINTASANVLSIMLPSLTATELNKIIDLRQTSGGFKSLNDFSNLDFIKKSSKQTKYLTAHSNYFLLTTEVDIDQQHLVIFTLLKRSNDKSDKEAQEGADGVGADTTVAPDSDTTTNPANAAANQPSETSSTDEDDPPTTRVERVWRTLALR
jgi:general secretion pathway protein K